MVLNRRELENLIEELPSNQAALGEIYDLMYNDVFRYIYGIVHSKEYAQDLTHDTFIHIYKNAKKYEKKGHPAAWIMTISRHITYMSLRKTNREQTVDYEIEHVDESMASIHDKLMIDKMMKYLDIKEREIIVLHVVEGLTFREVANVMDEKLSTVLNKYHRSLKKLKKSLEM